MPVRGGMGAGGFNPSATQAAAIALLSESSGAVVFSGGATFGGDVDLDSNNLTNRGNDPTGLSAGQATKLAGLGANGMPLPVSWDSSDVASGLPDGWQGAPTGTGLTDAQWRTYSSGIVFGVNATGSNPYDQITGTAELNCIHFPWFGRSLEAVAQFSGYTYSGLGASGSAGLVGYVGVRGRIMDTDDCDGYVVGGIRVNPNAAGNSGDPCWRVAGFSRVHNAAGNGASVTAQDADAIQEALSSEPSFCLLRLSLSERGARIYWSTTESAKSSAADGSWTEITDGVNTAPFYGRSGLSIFLGAYTNVSVTAGNRGQVTLQDFTVLSAS